jgi:hypothetical protein
MHAARPKFLAHNGDQHLVVGRTWKAARLLNRHGVTGDAR